MHRGFSAPYIVRSTLPPLDRRLLPVLLLACGAACASPPSRASEAPLAPSEPGQRGAAQEAAAQEVERTAPPPTDGFAYTLAELLELADLRSPAVAAARSRREAASGRRLQAGLWPNPRLEFEAEEIPARGSSLGEAKTTLGIEQDFPLGGRRRAAVAVGEAEERVENWVVEGGRRELRGQICQAWFEIQYLRRAVAELDEAVAAATAIEELARHRFDARAVPESELLRAGIELEELRLERAALGAGLDPLVQGLSARLGDLELEPGRVGTGPLAELPELNRTLLDAALLDAHPALAAASERQRAADLRLELAGAERWPDLGVHLAYGRVGATDESIWELGFSVPLPAWDRNQGRLHERRALVANSRHRAAELRGRLRAELATESADYQASRDAASRYQRNLVPAAERSAAQTAARYQAGESSLLELLDSQRALTRARLGLVESRRRAELALVRLWTLAAPAVSLPGVER